MRGGNAVGKIALSTETAGSHLAAGGVAAGGVAPAPAESSPTWAGLRGIAGSKPFVAARSFLMFLLLWQLLSIWNGNPIQLPRPLTVFAALLGLAKDGELWDNAEISTMRLVISLAVTVVLAVPLGFLLGLSRRAEAYIDPLVELLRPISGIAWIPLGLFIFGVGGTLPVFIMVYTAFFPLLLNTVAGVRRADRRLILAARTMGLSRSAVIRRVIVPASLPSVMIGFRLGFAGAWTAIVAAELIGAPSGLGFAIEWYRELLMSPKVFAYIMCIGFIGYVCDQGLQHLQHRLTPWIDGGTR